MTKTYCRNVDCPFTNCDKHIKQIKGKRVGVCSFCNFDATCRRYISWRVGEVLDEYRTNS